MITPSVCLNSQPDQGAQPCLDAAPPTPRQGTRSAKAWARMWTTHIAEAGQARYSLYVLTAANASPRAQRSGILDSALGDFTGFDLIVDCLTPECPRNRAYAIAELASFYSGELTAV